MRLVPDNPRVHCCNYFPVGLVDALHAHIAGELFSGYINTLANSNYRSTVREYIIVFQFQLFNFNGFTWEKRFQGNSKWLLCTS